MFDEPISGTSRCVLSLSMPSPNSRLVRTIFAASASMSASDPCGGLLIDDLRVNSDLFRNPLRFLHFVEQRMVAAHSQLVDLFDEMDHLGLYLENNNYSMYAKELGVSINDKLVFVGYRKKINDYYSSRIRGESVETPEQETPDRLSEIVRVLAASNKEGRRG